MSPSIPLIVGAYPIPFESQDDRAAFDVGLIELGVDGLELPDSDLLGGDETQIETTAQRLRQGFRQIVVTAIPGTMSRQAAAPGTGLASADEELRKVSVDFIRDLIAASQRLDEAMGEKVVRAVMVHSAPTAAGNAEAFRRSLDELVDELSSRPEEARPKLVIEHCDAHQPDQMGQKMFLPLAYEMAAAGDLGLGVTVNWGRSAIEAQGVQGPLDHIGRLVEAGLLSGLSFSGAGPEASPFGGPWADAHLPMDVDEPASLMSAEQVRACLEAAADNERYRCVKVKAKKEESVDFKLGLVRSVVDVIRAAG